MPQGTVCAGQGVALFVLRFPERLSPGRFDLWLHSHNLFHMLVVAGAVLHYHASLVLLRWRDHQSCVVDDHMLFPFYLTQ
jgi:adiponectin receptor